MSKINYVKESDMFKALGHPIRLKIVEGLAKGNNCNVNKIVENLSVPQSTISQHLKILKNSGIIDFEKQGVLSCYKVVDQRVIQMLKVL